MDVFLLELLLGLRGLPERVGELWDIMQKLRDEIVQEQIHKNREAVIAHKISVLSSYELEYRNILIGIKRRELDRKKEYKRRSES